MMADLFCDEAKAALHDPGGKVKLKIPSNVVSKAFFSGNQCHRYTLERMWGDSAFDPAVVFILHNPSVADAERTDDPTVAKCRRYATAWGYKRMIVLNVMAYRATDPAKLLYSYDPCGRDNLAHIRRTLETERDGLVICAWGNIHPKLQQHGDAVKALIRELGRQVHVLRLNAKSGEPGHPLYVPGGIEPQPWVLA